MKAVLQYRASPGFRSRIESERPGWLDIVVVEENDRDTFRAEMTDATVLLHVLEPVTAEVIAAAPELRLIQKIGVGVNTIDLEAAKDADIAVANMPGTNSQAVAEMTVMLMLAALRRLPYFDRATREGTGWVPQLEAFDGLGELAGRTVGLVGFGEVGRRVAAIVQAFGADVLYTDIDPKPDVLLEWCSLEDLLARADVISLHIPETPQTAGLIDAEAIAAMKPGAVLVNTARGGLVVEAELIKALCSGHLRAAGLDVFAVEPVAPDNPLLELENVVVSPHVSWLTPETLERSLGVAIDNCRRLRAGEPLVFQVL